MKGLAPRQVTDSRVEQIQIILNSHISNAGRLLGGQLMKWVDIVVGVIARRHPNHNTAITSMDNLQFKELVYLDNMTVLFDKVTYVGKTSMEVRIGAYVGYPNDDRKLISTTYFTMVTLNESDHLTPIPPLTLESNEEEADWKAGERRNELRHQRRVEQY